MDTYTIIFSVGGILALVGFVALITFFEDIKKWMSARMANRRGKGKNHEFDPHRIHNIDYMFHEGDETLLRNHKGKMKDLAKH